jgi:hypothetical protein
VRAVAAQGAGEINAVELGCGICQGAARLEADLGTSVEFQPSPGPAYPNPVRVAAPGRLALAPLGHSHR